MPTLKSRDELKIQLDQCGYKDLTDAKMSKMVTIELPKGSDREEVLRNIAKKLSSGYGAKYSSKINRSSTGHVDFTGGWVAVAKIKGGGGSGAGSDVTAIVESAQCIYLAAGYKQNKSKSEDTTYTTTAFKAANSKFDCDLSLTAIQKGLSDDWVKSSKAGANLINNKFSNSGKNYVAHRGSSWVKRLETHFKKLNREAGRPFGDVNKWSPADIWIVSSKGAGVKLEQTKTFIEFNNLLLENYRSGDIVGISLKKIVGGTGATKEINVSKDRPTYEFEKSTLGLRDFFASQDGYLFFDGGRMQVRSFGATWQGEIKGKNANMGKVSGGPIARFAKEYLGKDMMPQRELAGRTTEDMELFYKWYSTVRYTNDMTEYDFYKACSEKDGTWYLSKIMSTQLVALIESSTKKKRTAFISAVINYDASESELSGPYFKIY